MNNDDHFNSTLMNIPNHSPFTSGCSFLLGDDTVVLIGGKDGSGNLIDMINAYNVKTSQWTTLPYSAGMYI